MASEAGMQEIQETQKIQVEGTDGNYQPPEHEIQKLRNETIDSLDRVTETDNVQLDVSHSLQNSQDRCESATGTATVMGSLGDVALHKTLNENAVKPPEASEGEILYKSPSVTQVSLRRTSEDNDADLQQKSLIEKQKDITEIMQKDEACKFKDEIDETSKISEDLDKKKTNHDTVPFSQDTENREAVESSMSSVKCQVLEPTTASENSKKEIQTEELIGNIITSDETVGDEQEGEGYPTDGKINTPMVIENEQSEIKPTEKENSVVNITKSLSTPESNGKILEENQVTSLVSEPLVEKNPHKETTMEMTETAFEQKTKKPDNASDSSETTKGKNEQITNASPSTGISEEQTYQNDDEEGRSAENITIKEDHVTTSTNKNENEDVGDDAGITHTEDIFKQNTEETSQDEGKKHQLLEEVEAKCVHSDQSNIRHEPKEIEITSAKSEEFSFETIASSSVTSTIQDEDRNEAEKDKLSQKIGDAIIQGDEEDYRIKEAEIADACTEKYPQESVSSSPVSSELLNKAIHDEDRVLVENNHTDANPLVEVAKDAKNSTCEEISKAEHLDEPQISNIQHGESQEPNFELQVYHESETSNIQEEGRQDTNIKLEVNHESNMCSKILSNSQSNEMTNAEDKKRTCASPAVELSVPPSVEISIQQTHERNQALTSQISEDHSLKSKIAKGTSTVAPSVELSLEENLNTAASRNERESENSKEMLGGDSNADSLVQKVDAELIQAFHGNQDSRPDDLTKDEKIINADFEKLPSKTIKSSSVTEEILEENIQDEDREMAIEDQCFDSDKIVEETGDARGSGDEISKAERLVDSQTFGEDNEESQETNIKLLITHESADEVSNIVQESQSQSLGLGLKSISKYQSDEMPHITNAEEKERTCVPSSVEISLQQTHQDNQVITDQISEGHILEHGIAEGATIVAASVEFSAKEDHDTTTIRSESENEDQEENLADVREVDLLQQINDSQKGKIDSPLDSAHENVEDDIGGAFAEQAFMITKDKTSHDKGKEPQSLEEANVGSVHVNSNDRMDDYILEAENSCARIENCSREIVGTLSSSGELLKESMQAQDIKESEKDQSSNSDKLDNKLYYRDSGDKEISERELLVKELNKENDESHVKTTELLVTHEETEEVGNNIRETDCRNLETDLGAIAKYQSHEMLDESQASVQNTSGKEGVSSTTTSDEDAQKDSGPIETVECIYEEKNDNDANIRDAAGLQENNGTSENVVMQGNHADNASVRTISEIDKMIFNRQDEGCELHNGKGSEMSGKDVVAEDKAPDSPLEKAEKDLSISTSDELIEAREKKFITDSIEQEDIANKQVHLEEEMPESGQTYEPSMEDETDSTSLSQNEKKEADNMQLESLSNKASDLPIAHALFVKMLDQVDQEGTSNPLCEQHIKEMKDTEAHSIARDIDKDSEHENALKPGTEVHDLIHKRNAEGKCNPTEGDELNKVVSILSDSHAFEEAKSQIEETSDEVAKQHIYKVNEGGRDMVSEKCDNPSDQESLGSSVKKTIDKDPEKVYRLEKIAPMGSAKLEMFTETVNTEKFIKENEEDDADVLNISDERVKLDFEEDRKEEKNKETAQQQNQNKKLLEGYISKTINDLKEEDEIISNINQSFKTTTEIELNKAEVFENVENRTEKSTEVEELKTLGENSMEVPEVDKIKGNESNNKMIKIDKDQSAELPKKKVFSNEWEEKNDIQDKNEYINKSLHKNNGPEKQSDVEVDEKMQEQINPAQVQTGDMFGTANITKEQISNEENLNIVDSIEKKETEESKDEEKQNMSTVIWPLALGTVTTEDTLKEKENPTKSSISVALTIEEQNIIEKNVQTDEIALEEQLDNIPSINDGMLDEVNHDALHPIKKVETAASAEEDEANKNLHVSSDSKEISEELVKSSSSVAPNETGLREDKLDAKEAEARENSAGTFVTMSDKESLDAEDSYDKIVSRELKDNVERVVEETDNKTTFTEISDQFDKISNSVVSDSSEKNKEEISVEGEGTIKVYDAASNTDNSASEKESLDSKDSFDKIESIERKDKVEPVTEPTKDTNLNKVEDQVAEIRNFTKSDASEKEVKEETDKVHNATCNGASNKEDLDVEVSLDKIENGGLKGKVEPVTEEPTKESTFPKVEESHAQMKHDLGIVGIQKMIEARESKEEESNKYSNTLPVTQASVEEETFKKPGETFEKDTDSRISDETIEERIRDEIVHLKMQEKEETVDASYGVFLDKDVGSNIVPPQHNLEVLYSTKMEMEEVLDGEANSNINASSIAKESIQEKIKHHRKEPVNDSNVIPTEHSNEDVDENKTIKGDGSSVVLASQQIITEGIHQVEEKAVPSTQETEHDVEQHDTAQDVNQQASDDLPVSQFLLDRIMGGKVLGETDDLRLKPELHEESPDIKQNEVDISKKEDDEPDNHIKAGTSTPDIKVDCEETTNKSDSVLGDKSHNGNETTENGNEDDTQGLGNYGPLNKIKTDEEMISQLSEELNDDEFNEKTKQALSIISHSEIEEDVSPVDKVHEEEITKGELTHDDESLIKNLDASLATVKDEIIAKEESSSFVDMTERQPVIEIVDKTATENIASAVVESVIINETKDPIKNEGISAVLILQKNQNQEESIKESNPEIRADIRDSKYPDTLSFEKLNNTVLEEETTKTEILHDNEIFDKNNDVSLAKSTPEGETVSREGRENFTALKEIHTNIEMVEEVQRLQAQDGTSATTEQVGLKDAENYNSSEEALQHAHFQVAEGLGYVVVEQKHGEDLKKGSEEKKVADTEEKPQMAIEEHATDVKETPSGDLKESDSSMTHQSEMQQESVKEEVQIAERSTEEKLQSEQPMDGMVKEEKKYEQHVIEEHDNETTKLLEINEAKLTPQKKHGTILSEVRSKVKHSIFSVKKAITCSSSVYLK